MLEWFAVPLPFCFGYGGSQWFLFKGVAEGFYHILRLGVRERKGLEFSYLLVANDTLLFYEANED